MYCGQSGYFFNKPRIEMQNTCETFKRNLMRGFLNTDAVNMLVKTADLHQFKTQTGSTQRNMMNKTGNIRILTFNTEARPGNHY
jgi:site-specific DNA-adenine methylase